MDKGINRHNADVFFEDRHNADVKVIKGIHALENIGIMQSMLGHEFSLCTKIKVIVPSTSMEIMHETCLITGSTNVAFH